MGFCESVMRTLERRGAAVAAAAGLPQRGFERRARLRQFGRPQRRDVAPGDRCRIRACRTQRSSAPVRAQRRPGRQRLGGREDEEQERGENRVAPLHGCDHSTSRCSDAHAHDAMQAAQAAARDKNEIGSVMAAMRTQPRMFSMSVSVSLA